MAIEQTNANLDPAVGETSGYISAADVKQAFIQTYTDLASKADLTALVPDSLELTKTYVDAQDALLLPKAGGTVTGALSVPTPTDNAHAATKAYVDSYRASRNYFNNGDFAVNQRGTTSTSTNNVFIVDRWKMWLTVKTCTLSTVAISPATLPGNLQTGLQMVVAGSTGTANLYQIIEDVRPSAGKTMTLSFWAKVDTGTPQVELNTYQEFGTGGSTPVDTYYTDRKVTLSTTWTRYSITFDMPSASGKTITADSKVSIYVVMRTNATYTFAGMQLEEGAMTPFEVKPYGDNLRECQRYYVRLKTRASGYNVFGSGQCTAATTASIVLQLPVQMAKEPSFTGTAANTFAITSAAGAATALTAIAKNTGNSDYLNNIQVLDTTVASGMTAGHATRLVANNNNTAYIELDAEI